LASSRSLFDKPLDLGAAEAHVTTEPDYWKLVEVAVHPASRDTQNLRNFLCIQELYIGRVS